MPNELDGQELIDAFFEALNLKHLDECQALLRSLENLSQEQPTYKPWCLYLKGILAFEIHRDWAEAERIFTELLQAELEPSLHGRILFALGRCHQAQGRWEEAIAAFEHSLPIYEELGQATQKVKAWKEIAISYRRGFTQGDFGPQALQNAIAYCQQALRLLEPLTDPPRDIAWLTGSVWNTLGLVYVSLGQWDDALSCYQQDLAVCRALDDRRGMGLSYGNLGEIYQKRGQDSWPEALQAYQQALSLIREFDDQYEETEVLANLGFLYNDMGEHTQALDYYTQAIGLIENLRAGMTSEAARAGFFSTIIDTYANAILSCLEVGRGEQAFDYVERARARAFLDVLAARSLDLPRNMEASTMTLAEVQAALPTDALLIEYFTTGLVEAQDTPATVGQMPQRHRFPPARTLLFAVTHDGIRVHDTGVSPNDLRPRQLDSVVERHFLKPQIRRTLYNRLIAPIEELLQGRRWLYVVPHGPLHYIPFQALIAPDSETLLRERSPRLIYAPSATLLLRHGRAAPGRAPAPCLALGYNSEGAARLRFAEEEARSVAGLTGGHILVGPSPKKATLYDQATNYRLIHISCHGEFDPTSPLASALHLASDEVLTALDVLNHLRFRCDLVTLSACESGLSRVRRGDELVGFIRAFIYAGAPALVSTLWRVDERSTRILMEKFYQEIQSGTDFAEALRRSQLYLRNLTHSEVLEILSRTMADHPAIAFTLQDESRSGSETGTALQETRAYLKGLVTEEGSDNTGGLPGTQGDERVFSDPYYWAPFILVGTHGSDVFARE